LENELGKRLISIGLSAKSQIMLEPVTMFSPGDENTRSYNNTRTKLKRLRDLNNIKRIYIFKTDNTSLVDTDDNISIGYFYSRHTIDKNELDEVLLGNLKSSILFKGTDNDYYKTGYVPVLDNKNNLVIIGVEGSVEFFEVLQQLKRNIGIAIFISVIAIIFAAIISSRSIVTPIKELVGASTKISEGELDTPIKIYSTDEVGYLGYKFNEMRGALIERDNRMKMMLQGIAHEVRNPLGGIELFSGLISEEIKENSTLTNYINMIIKETKNLRDIVNEFLDFAKTIPLDKKGADIKELINQVHFLFSKELEQKNISFEYNARNIIKINIDEEQMKRAFYNLFENAIYAMPNGGKILIETQLNHVKKSKLHTSDGFVTISFKDTGAGISDENKDKLFTPFFTTKEKGTGLGLAFVKKIIESHNGDVTIESLLNKGTEIIMKLPI
jgi:signal transduction histidine kinase